MSPLIDTINNPSPQQTVPTPQQVAVTPAQQTAIATAPTCIRFFNSSMDACGVFPVLPVGALTGCVLVGGALLAWWYWKGRK